MTCAGGVRDTGPDDPGEPGPGGLITDPDRFYGRMYGRVAEARAAFGRPITLAEKVLGSHLAPGAASDPQRGRSYVDLDPDRVALQDALAQIVALQFMTAGLDEVLVPTTVHCDHLITAKTRGDVDLRAALGENAEVYDFLRSVCARYRIGFWEPGSGIIHQVALENYAFPGGMMIGTDSHTPNAGGLGMIAVGVGGGDAIDVMTGTPFNLRWPKLIGVRLTGRLSGWSSPKDVICRVAGLLTASGGTGAIIEYFGPGADTISATGKATICNMGAEIGATTSLFGFDANIASYLRATARADWADAAEAYRDDLRCDTEVESDPGRFFDQVVEIDLSELRPLINGPDTPDLAHEVADVGTWARDHGIPTTISAALVGSCTNSSYEDIARAASVARQASAMGMKAKTRFLVTPGSEQIRATIERDGLLGDLEAIGATVLANACGPCIGQWDREPTETAAPNTIVTSFNRNFSKRNDGNANTKAFVTSPEMVVAYALAGTLEFDPLTDFVPAGSEDTDAAASRVRGTGARSEAGARFMFEPPTGDVLPPLGFERSAQGPTDDATDRNVATDQNVATDRGVGPDRGAVISVSPRSERLQLLQPFSEWDGKDYRAMPVLVKAKGKCTTDHISAAGRWLRYRGHLENISGNLFLGATNAFTGSVGEGKDPVDQKTRPYPEIAKHLSEQGVRWCAVGDWNYGEGSSREHAAMEPRYRGAAVIFARSFARIHETNLKKQGVLPLVFSDPSTYDAIGEDDLLSVFGLASLEPDRCVECTISRPDGTTVAFSCSHTMNLQQIEWFQAGSALNVIRRLREQPTG